MKAKVEAEALRDALKAVTAAVPSKSTIPILTNVLIEAADARLRLIATNLDMSAEAQIKAAVAEPGDFTVSATLLASYAAVALGEIDLAHKKHQLSAKAKGRQVALPTLPAEDFPRPTAKEGEPHPDPAALASAMEFCLPACSTQEIRYYLCGVYVGAEDVVGTDGHRMHRTPLKSPVAGIVPREMIPSVIAALRRADARFFMNDSAWRVEAAGLTLQGKLIDGSFPDYERIMPRDLSAMGRFYREEVIDALEAATLKKGGGVKVSRADGVDDGEEFLEIATIGRVEKRGFDGTGVAEAGFEPGESDRRYFGVSSDYMSAALRAMPFERVTLSSSPAAGASAILFHGEKPGGPVCVVMEMRVA